MKKKLERQSNNTKDIRLGFYGKEENLHVVGTELLVSPLLVY
ncbi:MAG: hypothetical protein CM1200mP10_15640 [Candidatus Neomarinimicrobiota bacterium]|nr:MAG: hypothetical protein CM1200mP10_15640 [Candidatus Neomarinimicrobiota bacterium]